MIMSKYRLNGTECLGVEFGSTRIKAVLIDEHCNVLASGSYNWENKLENGYWTYSLDEVWTGLQSAYAQLNNQCAEKYESEITQLAGLGISAMMHGYLPFDKNDRLLTPFRTWRNTTTAQAADELTELFDFNIPQRWSISHLYQAVLNNEPHIDNINFITTLAGYVHWKLTGKKVVGIGEASGMFPIDSETLDYDEAMLDKFSALENVKARPWKIRSILPVVLIAGTDAGCLTEAGAALIDPSGKLHSGACLCPPEGDAGTGMVATNSISPKTGNVSAGTSIFSMIVLEKKLRNVYKEIDMVTTPTGRPVAMVHCNNCCTDFDYWVELFYEFSNLSGAKHSKAEIYDLLYNEALNGDPDCGGLVSYNYFSGEQITNCPSGIPLFLRCENASFNLANFIRVNIYTAVSTLKIGMEILENENTVIERLLGHGGLFKTKYVGQKLLAGAMNTPISVFETAGEGGAWGIALLAEYLRRSNDMTLDDYLNDEVFKDLKVSTVEPSRDDTEGFKDYLKLFKKGLAVETAAIENI